MKFAFDWLRGYQGEYCLKLLTEGQRVPGEA